MEVPVIHAHRHVARRVSAAVVASSLLALSLAGAASLAQEPVPSGSMVPLPGPLSVDGAWARTSPMMAMAGAAYMVIHNSGTTDDALVSVTSPAAATVELHETTANASGEMVMQPVVSVPVPAGGSVELKPGSYHVMLIGLVAPLEIGDTVELVLTFQSGDPHTTLVVEAPVSEGAPMPMPMPMPSAAGASPMGMAPSPSAP
jgi:periplasmic copper chaperone A